MSRLHGVVPALVLVLLLAGCAPALPVGERTCVGFPVEVCQRQVAELEREAAGHGGLVAYRIVCTSASCSSAQGDGTATVRFADGTGSETGFAYAVPLGTPEPAPSRRPLPVQPACLGIPDAWCREMARSGADEVADWTTIAAITVRCTGSCTATTGDGETRVRLLDGSEQTQGWNYNGELPPETP